MSSPKRIAAILLVLAPALLAGGCESTPLTAPQDGEVRLYAAPQAVTLDPTADPPDSADVSLVATVFDARGIGQPNVEVTFITTGGTLASYGGSDVPASVETNNNGIAVDTLTLTTADPASVNVVARSGTVESLPETVTWSELGEAQARLMMSPTGAQFIGQNVTFNGQSSSDPDGDPITCYQWEIDSTDNDNDEAVQGPTTTTFVRSYGIPQSLTVLLRVSTQAGLACSTAGALEDISVFSSKTAEVMYDIICDPSDPVAQAGDPETTDVGVDVVLDGRASSALTSIVTYSWTCFDGDTPTVENCPGTSIQACVTCTYTEADRVETATLTVTDENGCDDDDTVTVTVVNP